MQPKTFLVSLTESEVMQHVEDRVGNVCTNLRLVDTRNPAELRLTIDEQISQLMSLKMILDDVLREPRTLTVVPN